MLEEEEGRREETVMKMGKQEEGEIEMLLDEIPHATSPHIHHRHHRLFPGGDACGGDGAMHIRHGMCVAPPLQGLCRVHGFGCGSEPDLGDGHACLPRPSEGSPSPSASGLLSTRQGKERMIEELSLLDKIRGMHLGGDSKAPVGLPPMPASAFKDSPTDPSLSQTNYCNDTSAYCHSLLPNSLFPNVDKNPYMSQLQLHCHADANLFEPWLGNFPYGATELGTDGVLGRNPHYRGNFGGGFPSSINQPYPISNMLLHSDKIRVGSDWDRNTLDSSKLPHNFPVSSGRVELPPLGNVRNFEAFGSEDTLIMEVKGNNYMRSQWNDHLRVSKRSQFEGQLHAGEISVNLPTLLSKCDSMVGVKGFIFYVAKHQHGCRFLQRKLVEGKHQVDMIFNGVIGHAVELMIDPFGNYLMQKLLEVCSEEQLMKILLVLKEDPADLVRISLNIHGTRAVQKLIDTVKTRKQIALVISAIRPGFLDLIKDLNGSHVLQQCLQSFTPEDNKFIFDAAAKHCVDIATHRHGCCVLQKCIAYSTGEDQAKLVTEISANGYELAQDPFGNYVVQYILDLKSPLATRNMASQFEGKYVQLSVQKFSSNVVEKCLKIFDEDDRATIIFELISVPHFDQLLQDPYANYVIKAALLNTKGSLYAALKEAILPHEAALKTSPYCKRIFSRALLKK